MQPPPKTRYLIWLQGPALFFSQTLSKLFPFCNKWNPAEVCCRKRKGLLWLFCSIPIMQNIHISDLTGQVSQSQCCLKSTLFFQTSLRYSKLIAKTHWSSVIISLPNHCQILFSSFNKCSFPHSVHIESCCKGHSTNLLLWSWLPSTDSPWFQTHGICCHA